MLKTTLKSLAILLLMNGSLYSGTIPLYNGYLNMTYMNAKNAMMANATTATTKGYAAMLSNPAGLSTNYNATLYVRSVTGTVTDSDGTTLPDIKLNDQFSVGLLYDSFGIEAKSDDYLIGGAAYGYETRYGLFSVGLSYLYDSTDLTQKDIKAVQTEQFATGNYSSYGFMWQKSFIDEEDFYAIYLGYSHKNSGKYTGGSNSTVIPASPSKTSYGIGLETNIFDTTLLVTYDKSTEYWQSIDDELIGTAYGLKWMINQKFAIAGGANIQTFSTSTLKDIQTAGIGIEFGFLGIQTETAFTHRVVNGTQDVYLTEDALHLDVALTF